MVKSHVYFQECTQGLVFLPVTVGNCYYLGLLTHNEIKTLDDYLCLSEYSYPELQLILDSMKAVEKMEYLKEDVDYFDFCNN